MKAVHHQWWLAFVVCAFAVVNGCVTLGTRFEKPYISLAGIRVQEIRSFESVFQVDLRVVNPNDVALPIRGVECDLSLEGRHIAKGVANPQKEIAAYSSDIVPVTVYASLFHMVDIAYRLLRGFQQGATPAEQWTYAVKGHLRLGDSGWLDKIPFDSRGEIDLRELTGSGPK
ncbi:MAG: hypothetical protein C4519_01550 [Desulfobacteraceae bacterium]|nr:MAG: hypothetical protein C4519_01550 [Desulfobacteraceae bacterium]